MKKMQWMGLLAACALLGACASGPTTQAVPANTVQTSWNEGVWNSVMGYHGPANSMALAPGAGR